LIRVTDRTLSCLDYMPPDKPALSRFLALMTELDPGAIELSETMYDFLSPLPKYPSYVLRLQKAANAAKYPDIAEFVCPGTDNTCINDVRIRAEIYLNNASEATLNRAVYTKLRVVGLDDAICGDYRQTFALLRQKYRYPIEFCPTNNFQCATALAEEWAVSGVGNDDGVVTTFCGFGGFAATEELMMTMILRMNNPIDKNKNFLPEMASLFGKITKKRVPPNKPIIGKRIFHVESGIHVDGILKQPACYEPYSPDIVGQTRKIILGKQSGIASIRAKLSELKLLREENELPRILARVKAKAAEKRGAVTDEEFLSIVTAVDCNAIGINGIQIKKTGLLRRFAPRTVFIEARANDGHCERSEAIQNILNNGTSNEHFNNTINRINSINNINTNDNTDKIKRYLVDTTLRDGEQTPGIFFTSRQKIEIAALLDSSGVHQIEAGVPAASKEEKECVVNIIKNRKKAVISVWARLVPSDIEHAIDVCPDLIHVCVPVSQTQIREKLRTDNENVINRLRDCLRVVEKSDIPLSVGFEDAFRADADFMILIARMLLDCGITRIRLSDTVGVASPSQCGSLLKVISTELGDKAKLGIHAHNDFGMAVANTIETVKSGCLYADVTVGGIGERAGNCDLAQLVRASASIFDWGLTANEARRLQREVMRIIG